MDDVHNFSALGARPRRNVRRPLRYKDYEIDLPGFDVGYQGERESMGASYSPHHPDFYDEHSQGYVTPMRAELEEMQRERLLFQQSHEQLRAGLADFRAIHANMLQLLNRAESLQLNPAPEVTAVTFRPDPVEEKEDWPPPPPWPAEFKEEPVSSQSPVIDSLDKMMRELQCLKKKSLAAQQSRRNPLYSTPQPKTTYPPLPTPTAHSQPVEPFPPPQPPPDPSWRMPPVQRSSSLVAAPEYTYRGPRPSIPKLTRRDPGEFARLKMALENLLPPESTELFKYQVLLDHLHLEEAKLIADAYLHSTTPFTDTMNALNDKLGQPHQLALRRIADVMDSPDIRRGDVVAFERFALQIQSLVGMLKTLGPDGEVELQCGSHVARLLSKLPSEQRAEFRRCMYNRSGQTYTLEDLATWLKYESWCQDFDGLPTPRSTKEKPDARPSKRFTTVFHGAEDLTKPSGNTPNKAKQQPYCAYCDNHAHHLSQCPDIIKLTQEQLTDWIKSNKRCWRCARSHQAAQCTLKKPCNLCQGRHLQVLHQVNSKAPKTPAQEGENPTGVLYLDRPTESGRVLLKVVPVVLHHNGKTLNTHAVLDDGSERTMLLPIAAQRLDLQGTTETLPLRTIRQDVQTLHGSCVSFDISPGGNPKSKYRVNNAFTASRIDLAEHSYPVESLQRKYKHLRGLPLRSFKKVKPLLLIGSDHPQLITPTEAVRLGPPGGPAALRTRLGWTLQGPSSLICSSSLSQQCLFTTTMAPQVSELLKHVEKLRPADVIPVKEGKVVTRSREDNYAIDLLELKTVRVEVGGINRYATPLLRRKSMPHLKATPDAVMPSLRGIERRLQKDPERAKIYCTEIEKLVKAGSVVKLSPPEVAQAYESWYIPHHLVSHNGKHRLVFNCSFKFQGQTLNKHLLPGPTLGASLLGALSGAHLSSLLENELTLDIKRTVLWSDSTTVLTWLRSESCRFKVFVGTRIAEIQELTHLHTWLYVDSAQNPADDITRGKSLLELTRPNRWSQGPPFLLLNPDRWPSEPSDTLTEPPDPTELRKETFCGVSTRADPAYPSFSEYDKWMQLLEAAIPQSHGAAPGDGTSSADDYIQAEMLVLRRAQQESFPEEYRLLKSGKPISRSSRLIALSPEFDQEREIIRVGGRLRRSEDLAYSNLHPLVLDPAHPVTRLLIQDFDSRLRHPGPERVFAEIRRAYWILRGREAVRRFQRTCPECCRWRSQPTVPKMADLPVARLRLYKPAFYSTGMDCFGPFEVKIGRRVEKRWGIIFKCLTIRAVHLDVLTSIDTDSFLMALRRFIARRGTPAELYSDQGTNFRGGESELRAAFASMTSDLQRILAPQKIVFHFNPPAAPHFGGVWEREIRSVKTALYTTVGAQSLPEEVLRTVLVEVEGILNSKPLGYVSSDVNDPDPVTPNCLLMGRPDGSLPQVVYPKEELLSRRRWKHSQVLADHFWSRFIRLYLPGLQSRQKWQSSSADVKEGSVAMIVDPQLPRASWLVGRISKVHPSPDGHIRSADIKIKDRTFTRPVARLVLLPALPNDDRGQST